jgi:ATP-binding cassette subfamily B multidrug efflux pump
MHFDYGYMEDRHLGKPYHIGLLKRLLPYARAYKKSIYLALILTLVITLFDLCIPYLPKVAIDNYILSVWYPVRGKPATRSLVNEFNGRYGHLTEASQGGELGLIPHTSLKQIDPRDLRRYQEGGLISRERFYKIPYGAIHGTRFVMPESSIKGRGPYFYIAARELDRLPPEQIVKLRHRDFNGVMFIGAFLLFLIGASVFLNYWEYFLLERSGQHIMQDIRMELFSRIQGQAVQFFDRNPVGRLVTRATNDIENLNEMFKSVIISVFKDIFLLSGIVVVLINLNWRLALISFILLPFVFALTWFFSSRAREVFREIRTHIAAINAFLQERISGIRIIQLFAQEESQAERFQELNQKNFLASMRQIKIFAIFMPSMELCSAIGIGLLIWYGGGKVIGEQLSLGSLVAFIGYIQMFFKPIRDISEKYNIMQSAMASMERIFGLVDLREVIPEPETPQRPRNIQGHVQFKNVSFSYEQGIQVLDHVSLEIRPGQVVALVGVTGAGKTTIINLLERFYDLEEGSIFLDGLDIREWRIQDLRAQIGLVTQDVFIFAGSIAENISLGSPEITRNAIEEVARQGQAHHFISRLSGGLDHEVKEGGETLSAGERQLLALSRALAYHPRLLVLDEATSSVDPETERLIQGAISKLSRRQTTLIVAHRPSTIRQADRILVMHQGHIAEQGTHEELMDRGDIYVKLHRLQERTGPEP